MKNSKVSRQRISKIYYKILDETAQEEKQKISKKKETRGRKPIYETYPELIKHIKEICDLLESVDKSLRDCILYIDITAREIIEKLKSQYGYSKTPCENSIRKVLKEKLGYKLTRVKKSKVIKKVAENEEIFANVERKRNEVKQSSSNVVAISVDVKATKTIGEFSEGGKSWKEKEALDHDTNATCKVKPFGILDMKTDEAFVYCTTSNSTADFMVDKIDEYLEQKRKTNPEIDTLYIFLDNGPENSSSRTQWIFRLIMLSILRKVTIELVYYPPYHSKYNKIEHFWGVLQRSWSGLIIDNFEKLIGAINGTRWHKIRAKGFLDTEVYEKGVKTDKAFLKNLIQKFISFNHKGIEKWSLLINPALC